MLVFRLWRRGALVSEWNANRGISCIVMCQYRGSAALGYISIFCFMTHSLAPLLHVSLLMFVPVC